MSSVIATIAKRVPICVWIGAVLAAALPTSASAQYGIGGYGGYGGFGGGYGGYGGGGLGGGGFGGGGFGGGGYGGGGYGGFGGGGFGGGFGGYGGFAAGGYNGYGGLNGGIGGSFGGYPLLGTINGYNAGYGNTFGLGLVPPAFVGTGTAGLGPVGIGGTNPLFGLGLSPLAVHNAVAEQGLRQQFTRNPNYYRGYNNPVVRTNLYPPNTPVTTTTPALKPTAPLGTTPALPVR